MPTPIISVESLSKRYLVGHRSEHNGRYRYTNLRDIVGREMRNAGRRMVDVVRGRQAVPGDAVEEFWALKDVSFEVQEGEVLGIIGRNGAGKSTLLKILSRITEPTAGRVTLRGRVASLLEVGTGFHPELTGRENIYLNGAILGMSRAEIRRKFDEIVAFAEIERFLDTPVKRYSSGMYVRLAFAVAAHLEPEILIIDEVLAVGDADFQKKCLGKMDDVSRREGRTVLFVSHNMMAVHALCPQVILLDKGQTRFAGPTTDAISAYLSNLSTSTGSAWRRPEELALPAIGFEMISISLVGEQPALKLHCSIVLRCRAACKPSFIAIDICDPMLSVIMQAIPEMSLLIEGKPGVIRLNVEVSLPPLVPEIYHVDFWIGHHFTETIDYVRNVSSFRVTQSPSPGRVFPHPTGHGWIVPRSNVVERIYENSEGGHPTAVDSGFPEVVHRTAEENTLSTNISKISRFHNDSADRVR